MCGNVNALEVDINDNEFNSGSDEDNDKTVINSFVDHRGLIEVKIHLGNQSLESNEKLNFEIVFTAFQGIYFIPNILIYLLIIFYLIYFILYYLIYYCYYYILNNL